MNTKISLGNKNVFELAIGKRVLKKDLLNTNGKIPVYSANVITPFGNLEKSNISDFSHDYVLWGIDGNFMLNIKKKGEKFATTDHCGSLKILSDKILPEYILYELDLQGHILGFDRSLRASLKNMETVEVTLPIKNNKEFDLEAQKVLVDRYKKISKILSQIKEIYAELDEIRVEINLENQNFKEISLGNKDLFLINNGERIRKQDVDKAKGKIPVYSASKFDKEALGYVSDKITQIVPKAIKFKGKYITVNADGSVGKVFLRNEEFYANDVLNVIKILSDKILPEYILYELQHRIISLGYATWGYKLYKEKLRKIDIRIPTTKTGDFDMERQKEIFEKYDKVEYIKHKILSELSPLIESKINLDVVIG